ncbi:MAG TPA: cytochrome c biogenesis protein CcdA [Chloroflexota bacterium]|nr:cytochrome c biogenesis protein CcdA [Chloroflexota bacterium]
MAAAAELQHAGRPYLGAAVALCTLAAAVGAAYLTRHELGGVNTQVETAAAGAATALDAAARWLPLGYAFGAGLVATANPCGFVMLPAYLSKAVDTVSSGRVMVRRLVRAVVVSVAVSGGCIVLFGAAGLAIGIAQAALVALLPWVGLGIGVALVALAGWQLAGGTVYATFGARLSEHFAPSARRADVRGYFAYGMAYGLASLSCTLPIFLTVASTALGAGGVVAAVLQVLLYGLGMGSAISVLTVVAALAASAVLTSSRGVVRYVEPLTVVLLLLAGGYIVYYWLTLGGALRVLR